MSCAGGFYDGLYLPGWGQSGVHQVEAHGCPWCDVRPVCSSMRRWPSARWDDYGVPLGYVMPPKSIAVIVYGGDPELIGRVIYDRTPVGVELVGNVQVLVPGVNGQLFPVKVLQADAQASPCGCFRLSDGVVPVQTACSW
jgi:hypothetical protein